MENKEITSEKNVKEKKDEKLKKEVEPKKQEEKIKETPKKEEINHKKNSENKHKKSKIKIMILYFSFALGIIGTILGIFGIEKAKKAEKEISTLRTQFITAERKNKTNTLMKEYSRIERITENSDRYTEDEIGNAIYNLYLSVSKNFNDPNILNNNENLMKAVEKFLKDNTNNVNAKHALINSKDMRNYLDNLRDDMQKEISQTK